MPGFLSDPPPRQLLAGINFVQNTLALISSPRLASTYSVDWLPDCTHWELQTGYASSIRITGSNIKDLRISWHKDAAAIYEQPNPPMKIPIRLITNASFILEEILVFYYDSQGLYTMVEAFARQYCK